MERGEVFRNLVEEHREENYRVEESMEDELEVDEEARNEAVIKVKKSKQPKTKKSTKIMISTFDNNSAERKTRSVVIGRGDTIESDGF